MSQELESVPVMKTYIALKHSKSSAQVFVQVSKDKRIKIDERPVDHAFGQITFMDRDGKNKTIRLKLGVDTIDLQEQIKNHMIPANEKWTQEERDALKFKYGVLRTDNPTIQKFLETSPQFDQNWIKMSKQPDGTWKKDDKKGRAVQCRDIMAPMYTLYDETVELVANDNMFKKRLDAANKIYGLNLEQAQELMIRLNGSFFTPPDDLIKCRTMLVDFLDAANEEMLDNLLRKDINKDEEVTILIGKAVHLEIISFDKVKDQVVRLKGNGKYDKLKEISSEYEPQVRKQFFAELLTSEDGKLLLQDLEKAVKAKDKK